MQATSLAIIATILFSAAEAEGKSVKTRFSDVHGTTFIITVNSETRTVSADLRKNPLRLDGQELEKKLLLGISYATGAGMGCVMIEDGRTYTGQNRVTGRLECSLARYSNFND